MMMMVKKKKERKKEGRENHTTNIYSTLVTLVALPGVKLAKEAKSIGLLPFPQK